jgi:pyridoxal phosphate enzyme (YggS family)
MIAQNIENIRHRIGIAARLAGRNPAEILLVAVTKTHPAALIDEALACAITDIGENKVQDAAAKLPLLKQPYNGFHFIGHLQSNKINALLKLQPCLIHSIDSLDLAAKLNAACQKLNIVQPILLQINTTNETSKSGAEPDAAGELALQIATMPHLKLKGLMTIGALGANPEQQKIYFAELAKLYLTLKEQQIPGIEMQWLSMGMTDDFEEAIQEGSNLVRIGSAIFGARQYQQI